MRDRKRHLSPWIVATVIAVPVMYVASFGPACWMASHHEHIRHRAMIVYLPLGMLICEVQDSVLVDLIRVWGEIWTPHGNVCCVPGNLAGSIQFQLGDW